MINRYDLKPHPEGGYSTLLFEDIKKISESSLPKGYQGDRSFWNAIYYLLPNGTQSMFHRIRMAELWNFCIGAPLELYDISPDGKLKKTLLGNELTKGQEPAYVFPEGHWIAAKPLTSQQDTFSFVSCITAPGFTFLDWERGEREKLLTLFPYLQEIIETLTDPI